ncbi:peptidase [candidate division KSB1 bacterium]|nr:peptidase [candidate division KSB1 bacterium]
MSIRFFTLQIIRLYLGIIILNVPGFSQENERIILSELHSKLRKVKGIYVKKIEPMPGFKEGFEIALVQPVDHQNPTGSKLTQRIFLSHRDYSKPVVLETEGYGAAWPKERELAKILDANQVIVEHRYYEASRPNPMKWEYLTSWQAASDHHRIVEIFKTIYPGKWVSTGRSKGGMAALFHRAYYPDDVEATLTCVAPVMIGPVDARFDTFLNTTGDTLFRSAVKNFQKTCLERRSELLPLLNKRVVRQNIAFPCSLDEVLERAVLEFPYSFCFGNHRAQEIPGRDAPPERVLDCLTKAVPLSDFSKVQLNYHAGLYYQQFTELGYFSYSAPHIGQMLQFAKSSPLYILCPQRCIKCQI